MTFKQLVSAGGMDLVELLTAWTAKQLALDTRVRQ